MKFRVLGRDDGEGIVMSRYMGVELRGEREELRGGEKEMKLSW